MSRLVIPRIECTESENNYGRFVAEPLEKGFGITLGNSLRRILLSYLPGAAITQVRIDGIRHEFTTIPHAKEDVMEFLLNVKALRVKPLANHPGKLILDHQGEGRILASDIKPSVDFEITNPELCLITLDSPDAKLYAEFEIELGEGYRSAKPNDNMPVGTIPVDAIFTPMRRVNFNIEPVHIGQETSLERLVLDIWTDGTISPVDALSLSASILTKQFSPFVEYVRISQMQAEEQLLRLSIPDEKYNMPVEQLDLSVRTMNCLRRSGITTVGELISKKPKELLKLRNFGQKSFREIEERLQGMGLSLAPQVEPKKGKEEATQEEEVAESTPEETNAGTESPAETENDSEEQLT